MKNYVLRTEISGIQNLNPFVAENDNVAVVKSFQVIENFIKHGFKVDKFAVDSMIIGTIEDGQLTTCYPVRLYESESVEK